MATKRAGPMADEFVTVTLELIEEQGGSHDVNLREVARRVGWLLMHHALRVLIRI